MVSVDSVDSVDTVKQPTEEEWRWKWTWWWGGPCWWDFYDDQVDDDFHDAFDIDDDDDDDELDDDDDDDELDIDDDLSPGEQCENQRDKSRVKQFEQQKQRRTFNWLQKGLQSLQRRPLNGLVQDLQKGLENLQGPSCSTSKGERAASSSKHGVAHQ